MMKALIIALISGSLIIYVFSTNSYMLETLPWDGEKSFKRNIAPYLAIFLCTVSPYMVISTLFGLKEGNEKTLHQTERIIGKIVSIEYSGYRINNSPIFKTTISYNNNNKTFDAIPERVQFNLDIGSDAVVYYNPDNTTDSYFDLDESIAIRNKAKSE